MKSIDQLKSFVENLRIPKRRRVIKLKPKSFAKIGKKRKPKTLSSETKKVIVELYNRKTFSYRKLAVIFGTTLSTV